MTESPFVDLGFDVPVFSPGDDPIACLNKAMAFLIAVASLREDKGKIILVILIRAMLLVQGEILQVDRQELLNDTTAKVKDIWLGNALSQSDQGMQHDPGITEDFEQSPVMDFTNNEISSDSNIIPYSQYFQETQQATVQDTNLQAQQDSMILSVIEQISREKMIDSQMDDMIREKLALKEQIDSLEQNLSKQIKEKESLFKTL
ncbi:hypothetical protein Tco_0968672 [Tanacetum coccineum]